MTHSSILLPMLVQVVLTLWMFLWLAVVKSRAVKSGQVNEERRALFSDAWPESVIQVNNNIRNQFELPVLFYVLCLVLQAQEAAGTAALTAAWLFVISRIAHAWVHSGVNIVAIRRPIFMFGFLMVLILAGLSLEAVL